MFKKQKIVWSVSSENKKYNKLHIKNIIDNNITYLVHFFQQIKEKINVLGIKKILFLLKSMQKYYIILGLTYLNNLCKNVKWKLNFLT